MLKFIILQLILIYFIARELSGLHILNVFIVRIYIKYWFQCTITAISPKLDLHLLKDLVDYKSINSVVAFAVLKTMKRHLWYLSEPLVGLSFFDRSINEEEKRLMQNSLKKLGHTENLKQISIDEDNIKDKRMNDFVTNNTMYYYLLLFLMKIFALFQLIFKI